MMVPLNGKKNFSVVVLLIACTLLIIVINKTERFGPTPLATTKATIAGQPLRLQVADSESERTQGLSGQTGLGSHEGMLFVFEQTDMHCFWMKDMKFAIDILWFDSAKKLIYQEQNVMPSSYPRRFCPPAPATYVIEVSAGKSAEYDWRVGDVLQLTKQ